MKKMFLAGLVVLCLAACKKEPTINSVLPVAQHYYLAYNVTADSTTFTAHFSHPDAGTILPAGYSVTVNDSFMVRLMNPSTPTTPSTGPSYYYHRKEPGFLGAHFKLRKADGSILENVIPASAGSLISYDSTYTSISKSDTLWVAFTSDSLNPGESITLTIWQDQQHFTFQQVPVQSGDTVLALLPAHMNYLNPGPATMTITRQSSVLLLSDYDGTGSGDMRASVSAVQQVTIQL